MKLAAYFENEGAAEPIVLVIPKGQYLPVFKPREIAAHAEDAPREREVRSSESPLPGFSSAHTTSSHLTDQNNSSFQATAIRTELQQAPKQLIMSRLAGYRRTLMFFGIALILFAAGSATGAFVALRRADANPAAIPLWSPFLTAKEESLVIYSNPLFRGTLTTGLRLEDSQVGAASAGHPADETLVRDDTYTGVGEAAAIHQLTRLFDEHHATFTLKRSRLVTWDEARSRNLIFVGAPSQNTALHDLPSTSEFTIVLDSKNIGYIRNVHPEAGEPDRYAVANPNEEYDLLAYLPGLEPGKFVLIFSGLSTDGTQAAVEYACSPIHANELVKRAGNSDGQVHPFEAVLHTHVSQGVPTRSEVVAFRQR